VDQTQQQDEDEDAHLDEGEGSVRLEAGGPREDEGGLDVEHDEQEGVHVVANVRLAETEHGVGTGLIEMVIFIVILALGLVYAWRKGVLRWA